jgi:putative effector of murein hydrolase
MTFATSGVWLAVTIAGYLLGLVVQRLAHGNALANPTGIAIIAVGAAVVLTHTSYSTYADATGVLTFLLIPATVALGIPLARHARAMQRDLLPIAGACALGCIASMLSGIAIVRLFGGDHAAMIAMLPKAATTPVATAIAAELGGQTGLTTSLVIVGGLVAAIALSAAIGIFGLRDWRAAGLAAGTAGSTIAASQIAARNDDAAAFAAVGVGLCGLMTALIAPLVAPHLR